MQMAEEPGAAGRSAALTDSLRRRNRQLLQQHRDCLGRDKPRLAPMLSPLVKTASSLRFASRVKSRLQGVISLSQRHPTLEVGNDCQRRIEDGPVPGDNLLLVAVCLVTLAPIIECPLLQLWGVPQLTAVGAGTERADALAISFVLSHAASDITPTKVDATASRRIPPQLALVMLTSFRKTDVGLDRSIRMRPDSRIPNP